MGEEKQTEDDQEKYKGKVLAVNKRFWLDIKAKLENRCQLCLDVAGNLDGQLEELGEETQEKLGYLIPFLIAFDGELREMVGQIEEVVNHSEHWDSEAVRGLLELKKNLLGAR